MKRKTLIKLLSLLLVFSLAIGLFVGLNVSAEIIPPTVINFENDGDAQLFTPRHSSDTTTANTRPLSGGINNAFNLTQDNSVINGLMGSGNAYGRSWKMLGLSIKEEKWGANVRPTRVSFKYKQNKFGSNFSFIPLTSLTDTFSGKTSKAYNFYVVDFTTANIGSKGTINDKHGGRSTYITSTGIAMKSIASETVGESTVTYPYATIKDKKFEDGTALVDQKTITYSHVGSGVYDAYLYATDKTNEAGEGIYNKPENIGYWNTVTCEYDWLEFTEEKGFIVGLKITVTDVVGNELIYVDKIKPHILGEATTITEDMGFSFGFGYDYWSTAAADSFCIDDILIWSYNTKDSAKTYAPAPNVRTMGATMSVEDNDDKDINVKVGFELKNAVEIAKLNGEEIESFGALLVAGTKDSATMKSELEKALSGNISEKYLLKNYDAKENKIPDEYQVSITNSGKAQNLAKRLSAIGFVVTDKGVYVSENNDSASGIENGVINRSSVGLLKDAFAKTHLPEYEVDATAFNTALTEYNSTNNTDYTADDVKSIVSSNFISTAAQRKLLKELHFALEQ